MSTPTAPAGAGEAREMSTSVGQFEHIAQFWACGLGCGPNLKGPCKHMTGHNADPAPVPSDPPLGDLLRKLVSDAYAYGWAIGSNAALRHQTGKWPDELQQAENRLADILATGEPTYPCDRCGKPRTKAEGGTTFTVCDDCWEATMSHYESTAPVDTPRPTRPPAAEPSLSDLCAEIKAALAKVQALRAEYDAIEEPDVMDQSREARSITSHLYALEGRMLAATNAVRSQSPTWLSRLVVAVEEMEVTLEASRLWCPTCSDQLDAESVCWACHYTELAVATESVTALRATLAAVDERLAQVSVAWEATRILAEAAESKLADAEATADRWRDVRALLAGARLHYSVGGIDGARSVLKQMFDVYDAALAPSSARPEQGGA